MDKEFGEERGEESNKNFNQKADNVANDLADARMLNSISSGEVTDLKIQFPKRLKLWLLLVTHRDRDKGGAKMIIQKIL